MLKYIEISELKLGIHKLASRIKEDSDMHIQEVT